VDESRGFYLGGRVFAVLEQSILALAAGLQGWDKDRGGGEGVWENGSFYCVWTVLGLRMRCCRHTDVNR